MCPYTTFLCTKFQGNQITCFHFMVIFTPWQKSQFFESSYLGNALHNLLEIWNVGFWQWRASPQQIRLVSYKQHKVTYAWKLHYCSSCQHTHWYSTQASWDTRHTTMCLDYIVFIKIYINEVSVHWNMPIFIFFCNNAHIQYIYLT